MDLTTAKHPDSMVMGSVKIEITKSPVEIDKEKKDWSLKNLVDMGLARGVKLSFTSSQIDIKSDNGTVPLKGQMDVKGKVEFAILERYLPLMEHAMAGLVKVSPVGGTAPQKFTEKKEVEELFFGVHGVRLDHSPASDETIEIVSIKDESDIEWKDAFEYIKEGSYLKTNGDSGKCTITYMIHPAAKGYRLTKGSGGVAQSIAMKLTNKRKSADGRIISRTFEFPYGFYVGDDSITLKSKNDTDSVAEVPMAFEFTPHPDMLDDDFVEISFYRETEGI